MGSGSSKGAKRRAQTSSSLALKPSTSAPSHAPSTSSSSPTLQSQPSTSNAKKTPKKAHQESGDTFNQKHAEEFFKKYADDDAIGPDGMTRMCADWGIEPEDVVLLVVSFYMGAQDQGYFTRDEFLNGMRKLEIDSMTKLKARTPEVRARLSDPTTFKELYRYAFMFAKERDQKIVDLDTAVAILQMVMPADTPHLKHFVEFLQQQQSYRALNLDQWMSFLEWTRSVAEDLSNHDSDSAWPVLMDEYAEWRIAQQKK